MNEKCNNFFSEDLLDITVNVLVMDTFSEEINNLL